MDKGLRNTLIGAALLGFLLFGKKAANAFGLTDYGEDLGEHFSFDEFTHSDTAEQYNITEQYQPNDWAITNGKKLAQWILDPIRNEVDNPVTVNSWYRSPELNQKLIDLGYPAVANSTHLSGGTADITTKVNGIRRNDLIVRAILRNALPFNRLLLEHGEVENPLWVQIEFDGEESQDDQDGTILVIPSEGNGFTGTSGYELSRSEAEDMFL